VGIGSVLVPWYSYPPFRNSGIGGLSVALWELTQSLARYGVDVEVLVPDSGGDQSVRIGGVLVRRHGAGSRLAAGKKLLDGDVSSMAKHDVILSVNNFGASSLGRAETLRPLLRRQLHMAVHSRPISSYVSVTPSLFEYGRMFLQKRRELGQESALAGTRSACVSRFVAHEMTARALEQAGDMRVIPNGVDVGRFRPLRMDKKFDLIFVGRFQMAKGVDILFEAFSIAKRGRAPGITLGIIGEFSERERQHLRSTVSGSVGRSIEFLGKVERDRMPLALNSARYLVVPSRYESFGLPALEAISCGVPVIATSVGGLPELIDGDVGLLVQKPEPRALAEAITQGLSDTGLEKAALSKGPEKAKAYSWEALAAPMVEFLFSSGG
jgi:glycosyltransferase involved in cell wall biosynthesis